MTSSPPEGPGRSGSRVTDELERKSLNGFPNGGWIPELRPGALRHSRAGRSNPARDFGSGLQGVGLEGGFRDRLNAPFYALRPSGFPAVRGGYARGGCPSPQTVDILIRMALGCGCPWAVGDLRVSHIGVVEEKGVDFALYLS